MGKLKISYKLDCDKYGTITVTAHDKMNNIKLSRKTGGFTIDETKQVLYNKLILQKTKGLLLYSVYENWKENEGAEE